MEDINKQPEQDLEQQHKPVEKDLKVKTLRKEVLIVGSIILSIVLAFIVYNISQAAKKKPQQSTDTVVTQPPAASWYRDARVSKPASSQPSFARIRNPDGSNATANASQPVSGGFAGNQENQAVSQEQQQKMQEEQAAKQAAKQAAQQAAQERKEAMQMSLNSNAITPQSNGANAGGGSASGGSNSLSGNNANDDTTGLPKDDQNMTSEKRKFLASNSNKPSDILNATVNNPVADLVLSWGTLLPARLDKQINSDLPGQIYGHITRDVYDSRTHSVLLIPAGSQLVGNYDSAIAYGQDRLLISWQRVNFPNGQWLDLQGMGGADPVGAGVGDMVDNHYWRIFGATFLTSVLAAGAQLSQPQQSNALQSPSVGQTIGQSVGTQISQTGTTLMQKNINIQPTIIIRAGIDFDVEVNKDIVFPSAYTGNANK